MANISPLLIAYGVSNAVGLVILWAAVKRPKLARLGLFLVFAWAAWINYITCRLQPGAYLDYSRYAIGFYKDFINGWFKDHIRIAVTCIAVGQLLIASGMLLNGIWVKPACVGVIIFLLAIAPLGFGAVFPFSLTVSAAAWLVLRNDDGRWLWQFDIATG
ncbi:hypothetical protein [Mucilaginibacter sp. UR6-11]|uniref:hypothetical protein n=1 Tax=Mucilaginibacter sp. UR6-11 TaxID=1435644 RepID=UPI001E564247|nr:hypothetical protein [Mucilaginibacter sp. UR6-11]MCC8425145.1 hypothetical protein [Mucilaginibacter sp. UR6-11]